jgi:crotonobetainyl-CoA:carnitine CoA-transferase CaiB-like acyl-CoA transferase
MSITGYPDQPPAKAGVPVADIGCALMAVYGILSAYILRERTGRGQRIDASLFDSAVEGRIRSIGLPIKLSETKQKVRRHPPLLGEHTDEILTELGLGIEDTARMRKAAGALA